MCKNKDKFNTRCTSVALMALLVFSSILVFAAPAFSQASQPKQYRTLNRLAPFTKRGAGSPVAALVEGEWADGLGGGGYVKPDPNYKQPRTPDGQPDIQAVWSVSSKQFGRRRNQFAPAPADGANDDDDDAGPSRRGRGVVDPADSTIPYTELALARIGQMGGKYIAANSTCVPGGIPHQLGYLDSQIIQSPGEVLIIAEHLTNFRHIPVDNRPHIAKTMKHWMGDSRGQWQGNTLLVEVANLNDKTVVDGAPHSDQLHIKERFTRVDADTIQYEVTIADPVTYQRPWTKAYPLVRTTNYEVWEENCHDGNRAVVLQLKNGQKLYTGPDSLK